MPDVHVERVEYPSKPYRTYFVGHWVATALTYRKPALLFITEWGIWPSSENFVLQAAANLWRHPFARGCAGALVPGA